MSHDSNEATMALDGDGPPSHSPVRHPSISLQAAATLNASLQRESPGSRGSPNSPLSPSQRSPSTSRRRSQVIMNLQIADPAVPAPGEMVSDHQQANNHQQTPSPRTVSASPRLIASRGPHPPHHHDRAPSLGELHQELESEQEFQVNRLLAEIRRLQEQVQRHQSQSTASGDGDENASSDRTGAVPVPIPGSIAAPSSSAHSSLPMHPSSGSLPRSPGFPRSSFDRHRSRTPSRNASPRHRATSISAESGEGFQLGGGGGGRDESTYYQAEAQMLVRENQILRQRIRELERQLCDAQGSNPSSMTHEPSQPSHLNLSVSASEEDPAKQSTAQ